MTRYSYNDIITPFETPPEPASYPQGDNLIDRFVYGVDPTPKAGPMEGGGEASPGNEPEGLMGPFSRETAKAIGNESLAKGAPLGVAAIALGAPTGMAAKMALTSMGPMGALGAIGRMAYSGLLDKSYSDQLSEVGIDASKVAQEDYDAAMQAMDIAKTASRPMEVADVGYDAQYAAATKLSMDDAGFIGRLGMAFNALRDVFTPTSDLMGTTDFSRATGLHPGLAGTPSGNLAAETSHLSPSFGGDRNGGGGGGGGGNMGGGSAPGGVSGDRGDRGSGMGAGVI